MLNHLKKSKIQASARVVDGKLILSFPHAITPVVWQMDLSQVKASALEVITNKDDGLDTLSLKTPKGEKLDVAQFETREDAIDGLMAASHALENGHGRITSHTPTSQSKTLTTTQSAANENNKAGRWVASILGILLLIVLFGVWGANTPQTPKSFQQTTSASPTASQQRTASPAATSAGVPVSADDFLNGL